MEDEATRIHLPTLSKSKIPGDLSYPIGAQSISVALATAAQGAELKLHFFFGVTSRGHSGHYEFLRAEYLNDVTPTQRYPVRTLYQRPPQYRWEIIVQPVPRGCRHKIKTYIIDEALPRIRMWLDERVDLTQKGSDIIAFFFDEKNEEFTPCQIAHIEPHLSQGG